MGCTRRTPWKCCVHLYAFASFTSVSIFSVSCYSSVSISVTLTHWVSLLFVKSTAYNYKSKVKTNIKLELEKWWLYFFTDCLCQHCLFFHRNRCLKNTDFTRKEFGNLIYLNSSSMRCFPNFYVSWYLALLQHRQHLSIIVHRCPYSVATLCRDFSHSSRKN